MILLVIGAILRAIAVAMAISIPSILLLTGTSDGSSITLIAALIAGVLICLEYLNTYPSMLEFRDASPYNRIRYLSSLCAIICVSVLFRETYLTNNSNMMIMSLGTIIGHGLDFPYSPIRLIILTLPLNVSDEIVDAVRLSAGLAFVISIVTVTGFFLFTRLTRWPVSFGSFNVWTNLPVLDPTLGVDIVVRLTRDGRSNIGLALLSPFLMPIVMQIVMLALRLEPFQSAQSAAWIVILWGVLPTFLAMRGIAMLRISELIIEKRHSNNMLSMLQMA